MTIWLATVGETFATPIVSFEYAERQRLSHSLAWLPGP